MHTTIFCSRFNAKAIMIAIERLLKIYLYIVHTKIYFHANDCFLIIIEHFSTTIKHFYVFG